MISDSSETPPTEIFTNSRFIAFAIEKASDVFPTPGGPTKQIIEPDILPAICRTAKNSIIRSLMLDNPAWDSFSLS